MGVTILLETEKHEERERVYLQARSYNVKPEREEVLFDGGSGLGGDG